MSQLCNWDEIEFFKKEEFNCSHSGKNEMQHEFMQRLDVLRKMINRPLIISSGFRDISHPIEVKKTKAGMHTTGMACDILASHKHGLDIISFGLQLGFKGFGIQQKGDFSSRFIHIDLRETQTLWSY